MKINLRLYKWLLLLTPLIIAKADTLTLITGTPGDDLLATPSGPSPLLGGPLLTFSTLTPFSTFSTYSSEGITIASPDGLVVEPYSTQSNPNFLFDNSSDGTADITISLASANEAIGVGIADSDAPANIMLQALGAGDTNLGSPFSVTIPENTVNPGNGYFVLADSSRSLWGLQITETDFGPTYSGLAIADVQVAPEPSSIPVLIGGMVAIFGASRLRKKA